VNTFFCCCTLRVTRKRSNPPATARIAAILLLEPALDANYEAVKSHTFAWPPQV
jgi:hypothetical protein